MALKTVKQYAVVAWIRVAVIAEIKLDVVRNRLVSKSGTLECFTI
jgi:hypothetical protein